MEAQMSILDTVEKVIRKHRANRGSKRINQVVHNISIELDQMYLLHDIHAAPRPGYSFVKIYESWYVVFPARAQQKLFTNLLNQESNG